MILIIDNFDSFTYNVAHAFGSLGQDVTVRRSDSVDIDEIAAAAPSAIVISPGPGGPQDAVLSCRAVEAFAGKIPILGVCLGHQCIGHVFGANVVRARNLIHGKTSEVFHDGRTIYTGIRNPFVATRYHSLIVEEDRVPKELEVSAYTMDGEVMGLRSTSLRLEGVQFHPESIATPQGAMIIRNFIEQCMDMRSAA